MKNPSSTPMSDEGMARQLSQNPGNDPKKDGERIGALTTPASNSQLPIDEQEDELQESTWELLLRVMSEGEKHQLNSDILTPYHTQLLQLIAHHTKEAVRRECLKAQIDVISDAIIECYDHDNPMDIAKEFEETRRHMEAELAVPAIPKTGVEGVGFADGKGGDGRP